MADLGFCFEAGETAIEPPFEFCRFQHDIVRLQFGQCARARVAGNSCGVRQQGAEEIEDDVFDHLGSIT